VPKRKKKPQNDLEIAAIAALSADTDDELEKPGRGYNHKWNDALAFRINNLARSGMNYTQIAEDLGINVETFAYWRKTKALVRTALQDAKDHPVQKPFVDSMVPKKATSFKDYIYLHLPEHLKQVWDAMQSARESATPVAAIRALMDASDEETQKHLFVHAVCTGNFSKNKACSMLMLSRNTVKRWIDTDADFVEMLTTIHEIKKDYLEGKLFELIEGGDTAATLFANRTVNRETYAEKTEVHMTGSVKHEHQIDVDSLGWDLDQRRKALEAHRAQKELTVAAESVNVH